MSGMGTRHEKGVSYNNVQLGLLDKGHAPKGWLALFCILLGDNKNTPLPDACCRLVK